ncbi:nickel pincer cofactor biosynthesis protein LarC [Oceanispirochaeta sp.]|jgi:uncharacterized protein (TIGR00299 family) protein|uniref:nickel pincer cofactor biosynthesis protein LarC n=1 Tax=Oceanispirochaeta sp. TaxID=2035350 RepID=UPI0026120EAE|nr:nickel pincer cofactor biosynthesis protein LarC [Oceanispirochaeta sp.]MDA3956863.1 nickel pincer cofactor biosynthesis protein LarC [Oceanispirochaeta sp.]
MKVLYYDCFSGISGDMNLAVMVDLGVPRDYLIKELSGLHIDEEFRLTFETTQKMGITGIKADVELLVHHHHDESDSDHHHHHRNLHDIKHILESSPLSDRVRELSLKIFQRIAEAEAKVHGTTIDEVHFHEVGATDSIVDIVGAAVCFDYLKVDRIISSPVQVGGGFVECAHGTFPVPAPATTEILKGIPCRYGGVDSETTTPTGAAILAAMVDEFTENPEITVSKVGYGLGFKDFKIPNVLRAMLGESESVADQNYLREENLLIECNIDDMVAEDLEVLMSVLLEKGALDVTFTSIMMKKSRPAVQISVLTGKKEESQVIEALFEHSSTFGIRMMPVQKLMLPRETRKIETPLGPVRIKLGTGEKGAGRWKPEYEDIRALADKHSMSHRNVRSAIALSVEDLL